MKQISRRYNTLTFSVILASLLSLTMLSNAKELKRGDRLPQQIPFVMETDAIESLKIDIERSMGGSIQAIHALACNDCRSQKFLVDKDTVFRIGQNEISRKDLYQFSGKSGTVVFNKKTNVLTQVNFFDLED